MIIALKIREVNKKYNFFQKSVDNEQKVQYNQNKQQELHKKYNTTNLNTFQTIQVGLSKQKGARV